MRAGFTLVEVVVALALLAIGMAGGYYAVTGAMQARKFAHDVYVGTLLANNWIEHAKTLPFAQLTDLRETGVAIDEDGNVDPDGRYRRTTEVTTTWDGDPNLAGVTVRVLVPLVRSTGVSTQTVSSLLRRDD